MNCLGVDLVSPVDRMPPGTFPYLANVRVLEEGRIDSRPGYADFNPTALSSNLLHSIRRLNTSTGYTYVLGTGTQLWEGVESALSVVDTGYSGKPLSLLTFRPEQSPESWMYVYDESKLVKVNRTGTIRSIGVAPPTAAPAIEYGAPVYAGVVDGQNTIGWGFAGAATAISLQDRTSGAGLTIGTILYNSGTTGWCCISPSAAPIGWTGERIRIGLGGTYPTPVATEFPVVREIHAAISATTISGITYDSGSTGPCSIVLPASPEAIERNSLLRLSATETVRVVETILSPDGTTYSIRCSTTLTHAAGDAVTGLISWYTYTYLAHAAGEAITSSYILVSQPAAGVGAASVKVVEDAGTASGRSISTANDYLHISLFFQNPLAIAKLSLLIDVDPGTPTGTPFTNNYYQWDFSQAEIGSFGTSSRNVWVELVAPLSVATRMGNNLSLNLTTVQACSVALTSTGACDYGFDWWYNFGTYGATVQPNSPTGIVYESRFRDSTTGAASIPSPISRSQLFPLRELVIVTPQATSQSGVDSIDIYRSGGTLTGFVYDGTVANNFGSPVTFSDKFADTDIQGNPSPDLTLVQPWPLLRLPLSGTVNVVGTSVLLASGSSFPTALLSNSIILIGGIAYLTYGQPSSATTLQITQSAGVQNGASYLIASPTLAGQPLPFAFGPLEGPLAPVVFALGDSVNAGNLYWTSQSNADAASDANFLELCPPSEPLISGAVWNGLAIVGSRDNVYLVRYSYGQVSPYQYNRIPSASGFWSRWAVCRGPDGVYALGRDGIYIFNESQGICISEALYPLFPHDGQPAVRTNGYNPVDMSRLTDLRLTCADRDILFRYVDTAGAHCCWRYEIDKKRWFFHFYADAISVDYLDEPSVSMPNDMQLLMLGTNSGFIYKAGGNDDRGVTINAQVQLPAYDGGDERAQKLTVDFMTDLDGTGTMTAQFSYNNQSVNLPAVTLTVAGTRIQTLTNIAALADLTLNRNISCFYQWSGGPAGPRLYAFEPSGYLQPYLSTSIVTQFSNLSFQGWKHHRRLYPGIISTAPVYLSIWTDDGRTYGPYTIPSTGGRYRINQMMLDQNIKALAFAYQVTSTSPFAFFTDSFTLETKEWKEPDYLNLVIFKA
jgi:hypothetical protein